MQSKNDIHLMFSLIKASLIVFILYSSYCQNRKLYIYIQLEEYKYTNNVQYLQV